MVTTYIISSMKNTINIQASSPEEAIATAIAHNAKHEPACDTELLDANGKTIWMSGWAQYPYYTDAESGIIWADDFDSACEKLEEMFTPDLIADGAHGVVNDPDSGGQYCINIGQ